jgi:hypothetical protein
MKSQSEIIQNLEAMYKALPKDPLLERGIPKHWLCAINWQTHQALMEQYKKDKPLFPRLPGHEVEQYTGRQTVIIQEVETGLVYGDKASLMQKYPEWAKRVAEAMREEIEREMEKRINEYFINSDDPQNDS